MNNLKQLQTRFKETYPAFKKRQRELANEALDGLQEDADALDMPVKVDSNFLSGLIRIFAVTALTCVIFLNLSLPWSNAQTEIIWLSMMVSGFMVAALYFLETFAIHREAPRANRKE